MPRAPVHLAVLSVSDASGGDVTMENIVADHATAAGHRITAFDSVRDTEIAIRAQLHGWIADPDIDVVIVVGDGAHTSRALAPFVEEALPGFADLLRMLAFQEIGASAMLSTAEAARCGSTYVFVLPAHPNAVRTAMDKLILPQLDPQTQPRNLISSIPRLQDATSVDTPRAPAVAAAPPVNVPTMIPTEKTATGTGASPRKPARTGAHVIVRKVEDPTKPIELQKLEHQLELSKTGDEVTKQTPRVAAPPSAPRREPTRPPAAVTPPASAAVPSRPRARVSQPTPFRASPTVSATSAPKPVARTAAPSAPMPTASAATPVTRTAAPSAPPAPARVSQPTPPVPTRVRLPAPPSAPPVERARPPTAPPAPRVRAPTPPVPVRAPTQPPPPVVEDDAPMLSASDLEEVVAAAPAPLPAPTPAPATFDLARDAMFEAPSLRKSRVPMVIGLLVLAAAIGAGLVLWLAPRDRAPRDEAAVAPVTPDAAVIVASVEVDAAPDVVEPELEITPPDASPAPPAPAPARTAAPRARATAPSRPAAASAATAPAEPTRSAPPAVAAAKPVAPTDPDCEEVACVLEKYARPCCARYKPAAPSFQPTVGTGETLDRAQIRAGMNTVRALVITCAERFPVKGTVKLAVTVGADGGVQDVSVDAAPSDALGGCAAAAVKKARFAKTANGGEFTYPFVF